MGVQKIERAKKGVAVFMNDVWRSARMDFGWVRFRTIWVRSGFQGLKCVWWWCIALLRENLKKGRGSGTK